MLKKGYYFCIDNCDILTKNMHICLLLYALFFHSFNIALWPVWSFFTPLILFTQFMGVIMFISLLG